jgi:hypothetical protein
MGLFRLILWAIERAFNAVGFIVIAAIVACLAMAAVIEFCPSSEIVHGIKGSVHELLMMIGIR